MLSAETFSKVVCSCFQFRHLVSMSKTFIRLEMVEIPEELDSGSNRTGLHIIRLVFAVYRKNDRHIISDNITVRCVYDIIFPCKNTINLFNPPPPPIVL